MGIVTDSAHPQQTFCCRAIDPDGRQFEIQVVPVFGVASPFIIARDDELRPGPILRLVNRLLVRVQRWKDYDTTELMVLRADTGEVVHREEVLDLAQGTLRAKNVEEQIRLGKFTPQ